VAVDGVTKKMARRSRANVPANRSFLGLGNFPVDLSWNLPCFYRVSTVFLPDTSFLGQRWAYPPDFRNFTVHSAYYSVYQAYRALPLYQSRVATHNHQPPTTTPPPKHTSMFLGRLLPRRRYYCSVCCCGHVHYDSTPPFCSSLCPPSQISPLHACEFAAPPPLHQ
jgi:hypothetical protein